MSQPPQLAPAEYASTRYMLTSVLTSLTADPRGDITDYEIQKQAATAALGGLRPMDALQHMRAARIVAAHHAAMDCFRRAAPAETPDDLAMKLRATAVSLGRMSEDTLARMEGRPTTARRTKPAEASATDRATATANGANNPMPSEARPAATAPAPAAATGENNPMPSETRPAAAPTPATATGGNNPTPSEARPATAPAPAAATANGRNNSTPSEAVQPNLEALSDEDLDALPLDDLLALAERLTAATLATAREGSPRVATGTDG